MEISLFSTSFEGPTIDKENASKASDLLWFCLERETGEGREKKRYILRGNERKLGAQFPAGVPQAH